MKTTLIKQFGRLKPGVYDFDKGVHDRLVALGFAEAPKAKKKKEKADYEDKAENYELSDK